MVERSPKKRARWATLAMSLLAAVPMAAQRVPLDGGEWVFSGETRIEEHLGKKALRIGTGKALRADVELRDGTIDVDVSLPDGRSFVYLLFRMQDDRNHEEIYLRPHKSNLPDALQYSAVFNGFSGWQLYHGEGGTAAVELEAGEWVHLRLVVAGVRAAVFVGDEQQPALVVSRLARGSSGGYLGLRSFLPQGTTATTGAYFANLEVRPGHLPFDLGKVAEPPAPADVVARWQISEPVATPSDPPVELPATLGAQWRTVAADSSGILNFDRFVERPQRDAQIYARLVFDAESPVLQPLEFGASDIITVFFAGRPLFRNDSSYSFDRPRRQGVLTPDRTVYLPLVGGRNEVILAISDFFGGWGLIGRLAPQPGVELVFP